MTEVTTNHIGARVRRGPGWDYGDDQDLMNGSEDVVPNATGLGTIIDDGRTSSEWVAVAWDSGYSDRYRIGHRGIYDLVYAGDPLMKVLEL
jgi:hypothetical protein